MSSRVTRPNRHLGVHAPHGVTACGRHSESLNMEEPLWRSFEAEIYVTSPSRAFGAGQDRRVFDYLRPSNGGSAATKALKEVIVADYKAQGEPTA